MTTDVMTVPPEEFLVAKALELFGDRGYEGTTMRDIALAAGIRQLELYSIFPAKEAILCKLTERGSHEILEGQAAAFSDPGDVVGSLQRFVRFHASWHAMNGTMARVVNQNMASLTADHRAQFVANRATYERNFRDVLQKGTDSGVFDIANIRVTTFAILEMGIEIGVWYRPGGELSVDELASIHEELALRMVGYC